MLICTISSRLARRITVRVTQPLWLASTCPKTAHSMMLSGEKHGQRTPLWGTSSLVTRRLCGGQQLSCKWWASPSSIQRRRGTNDNNNNNRIQRRYSRFFTISSKRRELSLTRTLNWPRRNRVQITCNTSSAYHVQHVVLRATWYEGTAQLLSLTELKSHLFELYFVSWIIKPMI